MSSTADQILDAAESMIRDGGYYGFSFRQIADFLSIKSASVPYHFPTKEALGIAAAQRYTDKFIEVLGEPTRPNAIDHYVSVFKKALENDGRACLCGILAGETGKLPDSIREPLRIFADKNVQWLESALQAEYSDWPTKRCRQAAVTLFAGLEGGMTFAALRGQSDYFDEVVTSLRCFIAS